MQELQQWEKALKRVPKCPQRQDAMLDQLKDLIPIAQRFGMYDAADYLRVLIANPPQPSRVDETNYPGRPGPP